jgi:prepilin-type N-terminal cleavage/methylation domain-containing protein
MGAFACRRPASSDHGFTLVEVMMAALVLVVGALATLATIDTANSKTVATRGREAATSLGRQLIEDVNNIPFRQLTQTGIAADLQSNQGLESAPGSGTYAIKRRGFTYAITLSVCSLDDPRDGLGSHSGGNFCSGSTYSYSAGAGSPTDPDPEDYKRVVVQVGWNGHTVQQAALVPNPGSSAGPAVSTLTPTGGLTTITSQSTTSLGFIATTSVTPASVTWSRDGDTQGSASGSGTSWNFTWPIGPASDPTLALDPTTVLDGTYIIGVQAFDQFGITGAPRTVTMTLNRSIPRKPTGVDAGRNNQVVEIDWQANPEHDIVGYLVYRRLTPGGAATQVCSTSTQTSCQDTSPPSGTTLYYSVVALDRDTAGNQRMGAAGDDVTVTQTNNPPYPPTALLASTNAGTTILRWTAASPADPDAGDSVAFYRIYRDGSAYANRYDRTNTGADVSYTDTQTDGVQHTYYVTAVDTQLAESPLLGPVTK